MKAHPYIQNKRDKYTLSNPKNNYCKGAHSQHKHKEKNNWKITLVGSSGLPKRKGTTK